MSVYDTQSDNEEDFLEDSEDALKDKYLTFNIGGEVYGIAIRYVLEIIGIQNVTHLPDLPVYIKGVINLRGKVIPVIDVRLLFKMQEIDYGARTCIIVIQLENSNFGLIVDSVSEVLMIPAENVDMPIRKGQIQGRNYISGIGKVGDQVKILLDMNTLFSEEELSKMTESA